MKLAFTGVSICLLIIHLARLLAVPIAALVIAHQYEDAQCMGIIDQVTTDGSVVREPPLMDLPLWLTVYGALCIAVGLFFFAAMGTTIVLASVSDSGFVAVLPIVALVILILHGLFEIAWNIVGAVSLFRDCMDCRDEASPLWTMTLVALIFQWIGIMVTCCSKRATKDD